ncbi:MAG: hypothetical protein SGPRY_012710 [Prymnesium sp.]
MRRQEQELLRSNEDFFERMRQTLEQESSLIIQRWWRDILARKRARQIALLMERALDDAARKIQTQMRKKMERRMTTKGKQRERKRKVESPLHAHTRVRDSSVPESQRGEAKEI